MNDKLKIAVLAVIIIIALAFAGYYGKKMFASGDTAVGFTNGKPMTQEEGQAMMRKMRGH